MAHVTGVGGVFFKAKGDARVLAAWYQEHLGILPGMVAKLRASGTTIVDGPSTSEYGTFASVLDPDGNKVELWEP
jgi:predicted enzyme related to lactoylglutathione lyase